VVEWLLNVIFCFLTCTKFDFGEFEKAMFPVVAKHFATNFLPLDQPKMRLGWVEKAMFQGLNFILNTFSACWPSENATWVRSRKRDSSSRMALSTYFRPLDQHKMQLRWIHKSVFSRVCKALRTHFLPLDLPKMRLGWSRKSDDSTCRMSIGSHFLLIDQPKMRIFSSR